MLRRSLKISIKPDRQAEQLRDASANGNAEHEKPAIAIFKCAGETR